MKHSWDASSSEDESSEVAEPEPIKQAQKSTGKSSAQNKVETPNDRESEDSDGSDDESDDEESEEDEDQRTEAEIKKEKAWQRIMVSSSRCFD